MFVTNFQRIIMVNISIMIRFSLLLILLTASGKATTQVSFPVKPDCSEAAILQLSQKSYLFQSSTKPSGFGSEQEMNAMMGDTLWINREHNSSWLSWKAPFSGYLGLNLIPDSIQDDYDFLLFRDTALAGCEAILSHKLRPERSLISRNDPGIMSITGLNGDMRVNHVGAGPGPSFGKAVRVKKGESWIMLVDNVYDNGGAFTLNFQYYYAPAISGIILSATSDSPLVANIRLTEISADSLLEEFTSLESGEFNTTRLLEFESSYQLRVECAGFFPNDLHLNYQTLRTNRGKPLVIKLVENRPGAILDLPQAHFQAGTAVFLPSAYLSLNKMVDLLTQYPSLHIRIDGHVNGVGTFDCEHDQSQQMLSSERAIAVMQYLIRHGIDEYRLSIKGWGCTKMLYPNARNEKEMAANRRVELVVQ